MAFSDTALRNLKPGASNYERSDGGGMYIEVAPSGRKTWGIRYRLAGTMIVEFRGEITGHYLGEIPWSSPTGQATVLEGFARGVRERIPLFNEVDIITRHGAHRQIFTGIWPLAASEAAPIDRFLALEDYGTLTRDELA